MIDSTETFFLLAMTEPARGKHPSGGLLPRVCFAAACRKGDTGSNGDDRVRTDDPLLAKQVLSQLSYAPRTQ